MDKEQKAIQRLQEASKMSLQIYEKPLIVTTSGGKDSSVCVELARRAGIPFEVMHNHTTADAPETVHFVRSELKRLEGLGIKCTINYPTYKGEPTSMWKLIPQKLMPPTRVVRYCCDILKERGGKERFIVTGVRWAESAKRRSRGVMEVTASKPEDKIILANDNDEKRQMFETCKLKAKRVVNPIIDWTNKDVWDYIQSEKIPCNCLYEEGQKRVGCVGCPLSSRTRQTDFARWPAFKRLYINAFQRMVEAREKRGIPTGWSSGVDVFHWWMEDGVLPGQIEFNSIESEATRDLEAWNEDTSYTIQH